MEKIFPTLISRGRIRGADKLNRKLLIEIRAFSERDKMGRDWSKTNYPGGYTSYASLSDMHYRSPLFSHFADLLQPHAEAFARAQGWNMKGLILEMSACWINVMPKHTYHGLHLHPHSAISGAYYVNTPRGSVSLRLEDPRMGLYMNAPAQKTSSHYHEIEATAGTFVLFESWMRHEVPPNQSHQPRVSLSFNYSIEADD